MVVTSRRQAFDSLSALTPLRGGARVEEGTDAPGRRIDAITLTPDTTARVVSFAAASSPGTVVIFNAPQAATYLPLVLQVAAFPELRLAANCDGSRFPPDTVSCILRQTRTILESLPEFAHENIAAVPS